MFKKIYLTFIPLVISASVLAQTVQIVTRKDGISLRGLSVVNDSVIWASGTKGTIAKSTDGGNTWVWANIPNCTTADFRDIEVFNKNTVTAMAITQPAVLLRTEDGGKNWHQVFKDTSLFLDAMDFLGANGAAVADPVNGKMVLLSSSDWGNSWTKEPVDNVPDTKAGEAFFAASGANVKLTEENGNIYKVLVSGGNVSRLFILGAAAPIVIPIVQGKETTGANAVAITPRLHEHLSQNEPIGIIVGGDFNEPKGNVQNCVLFGYDLAKNEPYFIQTKMPPSGYKSSVVYINDKKLVTCGTSGVDVSDDGGYNWKHISDESFHVCQKAKEGRAIFLAGPDGKIAKLLWP